MSDYILPEVWENPTSMGGAWGGLNQPTAGARFEQTLLKVTTFPKLYSSDTKCSIKAAIIMLEELKELGVTQAGYDAYRIKIGDGDQFGSDFVSINPNSKIPAMMDYSEDQAVRVFESANILLYLAEKFGKLIPTDHAKRTEVLNWLLANRLLLLLRWWLWSLLPLYLKNRICHQPFRGSKITPT